MKKFLLGLMCCILLGGFSFQAVAKNLILSHWLEIGINNQWIVRVVTTDNQCPVIKTSQGSVEMGIRSTPNDAFPVTICQAVLPPQTTHASLNGQILHLPKANPKRIVIIGDTGCRIKDDEEVQDCNDPRQWPLPVIARFAAKFKPDLVIHVGDYLYRESSCPPGDKGCLNSPHGDNWATWRADFIHPVEPLLVRAPWVFARGNHETCDRGGEGWTKLLDPYSFKHCFNHSPVYSVDMGDTRLYIIDSANASDLTAPPEQVSWYQNYLNEVRKSNAKHTWIVTHKPFWFVYKADPLTQAVQGHVLDTLQMAWLNSRLTNVDLLVSGHLHRFQAINFGHDRPPQLIVGASGTELDENMTRRNLEGLDVANEEIKQGLSLVKFGFFTMEREGDIWHGQIRNPHGKVLARCVFKNRQFDCVERKG